MKEMGLNINPLKPKQVSKIYKRRKENVKKNNDCIRNLNFRSNSCNEPKSLCDKC